MSSFDLRFFFVYMVGFIKLVGETFYNVWFLNLFKIGDYTFVLGDMFTLVLFPVLLSLFLIKKFVPLT